MRISSFMKRSAAGVVVLAIGAGTLLAEGIANADVPQGTLTLTPTDGRDIEVPNYVTSGPCPAAANAYNIRLQGPGGLDNLATTRTTVGFSTTAPLSGNFGLSFEDTAATDTPPVTLTAGTYTVTLQCVSGLGSTIQGTFVGTVIFDTPTHYTVSGPPPSGSPTPSPTDTATPSPTDTATPSPTDTATPSPTDTATPSPTDTATPTPVADTKVKLKVIRVDLPFGLGGFAIPLANVSPSNTAGTVQFKDGDTNLGGPVPVFGGVAFGPFTFLPPGRHSVIAVFTQTNPAINPSTSNTVNFRFSDFSQSIFGGLHF